MGISSVRPIAPALYCKTSKADTTEPLKAEWSAAAETASVSRLKPSSSDPRGWFLVGNYR